MRNEPEIEISVYVSIECACCESLKGEYVDVSVGHIILEPVEYGKAFSGFVYDDEDGKFYCQECYDYREENEGECEYWLPKATFTVNQHGQGVFRVKGEPSYTLNQGQVMLAHSKTRCLLTFKKRSPLEVDISDDYHTVLKWWWGRTKQSHTQDEIERMEFEESIVNETWGEDYDF